MEELEKEAARDTRKDCSSDENGDEPDKREKDY